MESIAKNHNKGSNRNIWKFKSKQQEANGVVKPGDKRGRQK